jgi:hypothetical protein
MDAKRTADLELNEDLPFQYREWRFQRFGWVLIGVFVAAGLAGAFGGGLLSQTRVSAPDGSLQVEYERFARMDAPTRVTITMFAPSPERQVRVELDRAYLDAVVIEQMAPVSQQVLTKSDRVVHVFDLAQPGQPMTATLHVRPLAPGLLQARLTLGQRSVTLRQLVYP